jgi:hypothetical protein
VEAENTEQACNYSELLTEHFPLPPYFVRNGNSERLVYFLKAKQGYIIRKTGKEYE